MSSTYSNLKFELIANGEQSGAWGTITNTNLGTAIEQAIVGMATLTSGDFTANVATLTLINTNTAQNARALCLVISASSLSAAGTLNVPAIQKPYIVINNDSYALTIKVSGLTGVVVPAGKSCVVYNNGTDVVSQITHIPSLTLGAALPIASGGTGSTSTTFVNAATNVTGTLPIANGGTGLATITANNVILGNGTSAVQVVAPGTSGNILTSNGTTWSSTVPAITLAGTQTFSGAQTFTGGINVNASVLYSGPTKQVVTSITASTATTTVDLSTADTFLITIAANTSLVFSNAPTGGVMKSFNLILQNNITAGYAVAFPGSVSWAGGSTPPRTTSANARDLWAFFSIDGSTYAGSLSIKNY
jgi:hypothetical protein